jgi:hypothetical protein
VSVVKGRCSLCGSLVATLDGDVFTTAHAGGSWSSPINDEVLASNSLVASCSNGHAYVVADIVVVLRRSQHLGKASVKIPPSALKVTPPTTV